MLVLTRLGGVCAAPTLYLKTNRNWRLFGAILLVIAALIFVFVGYLATGIILQNILIRNHYQCECHKGIARIAIALAV
ncbi:hypothetical protein [Fischerella sp. JS2]|uniref:hypothetical protein n=1 Tax=Fischerella sp. JS2 TaxID=2597771 RepID=UPI0028E2A7C8|nr:hypothetical protein [Fischerella sp. JS2]